MHDLNGIRYMVNSLLLLFLYALGRHKFLLFCLTSAMLTVDNDEFWEGVSPVEFGSLPALQDAVTVVGYPIGGDTISVTSGVVSRIEILSYVHGSTELLGLQVGNLKLNSGLICPSLSSFTWEDRLLYLFFIFLI